MNDYKFIIEYLNRIDYHDKIEVNVESLKALQRHHLASVPFENLDIMNKTSIQFDKDYLSEKIICQKRGGICYELNGLFAELLRCIGFDVSYLSAKVPCYDNEFDHLFLLVKLEEEWLVDVGYGDGFFTPLQLVEDIPQEDNKGIFRILRQSNEYELWRNENNADSLEYTFTLMPRQLGDFYERCRFFEVDEESRFNKNRLCSLEKFDERISLTDSRLLYTNMGIQNRIDIKSEKEFENSLKNVFNIRL